MSKRLADNMRERYLNRPVAILCARYWYRGILSEVSEDHIVLSRPLAVEVTGPASAQAARTEDPIPSDILISTGAVELICQPTWCFNGLT